LALSNLEVSKWFPTYVITFWFFRKLSETIFCGRIGISSLVYSSYRLRQGLQSWCNVLITSNLIFGWDCGKMWTRIFSYELGLIFELMLDSL